MEPLQIAEKIKNKFPEDVVGVTEFRGQVSVHLKKDNIFEICHYLRDHQDLSFDLLKDLCGVDYLNRQEPRFEVVYHLYSMEYGHFIRLRAQVPEEDPSLCSVIRVWRGADWHERECFDLMGISFDGHPDLRRILLPDDWEGHPLRKDYPEEGFSGEDDYRGFREVVEKSRRLGQFEWERRNGKND
jgi:NADH-quinone oxidoreductase subunit C